jgi:hypothetical protein
MHDMRCIGHQCFHVVDRNGLLQKEHRAFVNQRIHRIVPTGMLFKNMKAWVYAICFLRCLLFLICL